MAYCSLGILWNQWWATLRSTRSVGESIVYYGVVNFWKRDVCAYPTHARPLAQQKCSTLALQHKNPQRRSSSYFPADPKPPTPTHGPTTSDTFGALVCLFQYLPSCTKGTYPANSLLVLTDHTHARLPQIIKTVFFLDLPMYRFNEETDGKRAYEEEKQKVDNDA